MAMKSMLKRRSPGEFEGGGENKSTHVNEAACATGREELELESRMGWQRNE
jgi:hypothetical protein